VATEGAAVQVQARANAHLMTPGQATFFIDAITHDPAESTDYNKALSAVR
jgi:hypothetical protein